MIFLVIGKISAVSNQISVVVKIRTKTRGRLHEFSFRGEMNYFCNVTASNYPK